MGKKETKTATLEVVSRFPTIEIDQEHFDAKGNCLIKWNGGALGPPAKITRHEYATVILLDSGESSFIISWSTGQSRRTSWAVLYVGCDMTMKVRNGNCKDENLNKKVNRALRKITKHWPAVVDARKAAA